MNCIANATVDIIAIIENIMATVGRELFIFDELAFLLQSILIIKLATAITKGIRQAKTIIN